MKNQQGFYEQVIYELLQSEISRLPADSWQVEKAAIDKADSHEILADYLAGLIKKAFQSLPQQGRLERQIQLANDIIDRLQRSENMQEFESFKVSKEAKVLHSILHISQLQPKTRPVSGLSQCSLFTGAAMEPSLASELQKEIATSHRIDILMSFIRWSGLRIIADELIDFTQNRGGHLRIITTTYMGATEIAALNFLSKLPNTEIRVSTDNKRTRLHAKAYYFYRNTGFSTAYVGSSNISNPALTTGLEWNMKISQVHEPHILKKFEGTFESYWNSPDFLAYSAESHKEIAESLESYSGKQSESAAFQFDIRPYPFQKEILEKLQAEREVHDKWKNLVVAATGTGKTVIAAFDFKRFREKYPQARFLFIAHRQEILTQSLYCFRGILRDQNFGELFVGNHTPNQFNHLFVSVQMLHSQQLWRKLPKDHYDYIVVDEFHHAEANTYRQSLTFFTPKILLGLTATPERMDGGDILGYFDNRIAAEIRLPEAIERGLLAPFQYFGVSDSTNYKNLTWSRGGYKNSELERLLTGNDLRLQIVLNALEKYIPSQENVVGLGFCVSVAHAEYMAEAFCQRSIPAAALTSHSDAATREQARNQLERREIRFIFTVDLFNEGVDIPAVNTVLFLRPTESLTIFLQQLGRGLRLYEGKECLTVLDFIGQAHQSFRYDQRFRALVGRTNAAVQREVEESFPHLPSGCVIKLERTAKEHVLNNIRSAISNNRRALVRQIANFEVEYRQPLSLQHFVEAYQLDLSALYRRGNWSELCADAGVIQEYNDPHRKYFASAMKRILHFDSRRMIQALQAILDGKTPAAGQTNTLLQHMLYISIWQKPLDSHGFSTLQEAWQCLRDNRQVVSEMRQLLKLLHHSIHFVDTPPNLPFECPLDLHCHYTRDEILAALGEASPTAIPAFREGVRYVKHSNTDVLLVTLNKSEEHYSPTTMYDDYAISEELFHWQSQSTTSVESPTGQRYLRGTSNVLLFVRENKKVDGITMPYCFLGPVQYARHDGSKPISIVWKLKHSLPAQLWRETGRLAAV
ncbi:DUF3427 domain-containing protein [Desulfurispira natronophila]|uniref:Superfamily II DNA or RNA helicase n=1 Tax=Desulfurispira natronophila TaxID=682562 RepID=A0A7W7Y598_9BACT|nr:superfamily II DNA or RNA helicase [Desulfurispira natronophila]